MANHRGPAELGYRGLLSAGTIAVTLATVSGCAAHHHPSPSEHRDPLLESLIDDTGRYLVESSALPGEAGPQRKLPYPFNFQAPNGTVCTQANSKVSEIYFCRHGDRWVQIAYVVDGFAIGPASWIDPSRDWHPAAGAGRSPVNVPAGHRVTLSKAHDTGDSVLVCGVPDPTELMCRLRSNAEGQARSTKSPVPVEHGFVVSSTGADRVW